MLLGQQYDEYGDRVKWWTDSSIQNFKERTQCFVNQYDQYTLQGFKVGGQPVGNIYYTLVLHCMHRLTVS